MPSVIKKPYKLLTVLLNTIKNTQIYIQIKSIIHNSIIVMDNSAASISKN